MPRNYKIFISYPSTLDFLAWRIQGELENCGAGAFLDSLIPFGTNSEKAILDYLRECDALWVLMTPPLLNINTEERIAGSIERPYVMLEAGAAWCRNIPIIPLLVNYSKDDFAADKNIPLVIKEKQAIEMRNKHEYQRLLDSVTEQVASSRENRRRSGRIPLNLPVDVVCKKDGSCSTATILEFSEDGGGCFISTENGFSVHDTIRSTFSADIIHIRPPELGQKRIPGIGMKISRKSLS